MFQMVGKIGKVLLIGGLAGYVLAILLGVTMKSFGLVGLCVLAFLVFGCARVFARILRLDQLVRIAQKQPLWVTGAFISLTMIVFGIAWTLGLRSAVFNWVPHLRLVQIRS